MKRIIASSSQNLCGLDSKVYQCFLPQSIPSLSFLLPVLVWEWDSLNPSNSETSYTIEPQGRSEGLKVMAETFPQKRKKMQNKKTDYNTVYFNALSAHAYEDMYSDRDV